MSMVDEELPETLPRWEIPSDWQWVSIADVGRVITGNTPPTKDESNYGDYIPFVKPPALIDRGIRSTPEGLSKSGAESSRTLPAGAVLVSCIGGLGKTGIAKIPVAFNQQINAIVFDQRVVPEFGFYYSQTLKPWLHGVASATTLPIVNKGKFQRAPFPLAPLDQQKLIVAEIEKQFSRLDEAIANHKRVKANLKRYRAAVLKAAVEGRLVETEAELARREGREYETGEQLIQRILEIRSKQWKGKGKYKEPVAPDITDLHKLPEGWAYATAEQLTDENRAITYGVIKLGKAVNGGVSILRSSDVRQLRIDLDNVKSISHTIAENYHRTFLRGGEVVITIRGTLGGIAVVPQQCNGFNVSREVAMLALVEPKMAHLAALFIASVPLESWLMRRTKGIAYTGVNIETLKALPIPVPPLVEQSRIIAEVDRRLSLIRKVESQVEVNLKRAGRLRLSILSHAFSGNLSSVRNTYERISKTNYA